MDYTREAFTFPAGNVRVTLDYDIRYAVALRGVRAGAFSKYAACRAYG